MRSARLLVLFILAIAAPAAFAQAALEIATDSLPGSTLGASYSQTLAAAGGTEPYAWSLESGALPRGLALGASSGTLSGKTTLAGTYDFTVKVTDSADPAVSATKAFSIVVTFEDSDHDGLPDSWEEQHWDNLDQAADDNPDGDAWTNIEEFERGTDPTVLDNAKPTCMVLASLPTTVRLGVDTTITIVATGDDRTHGASIIVAGECWVGEDPGVGNGTPLVPSDGWFDSAAESLTGPVDVSGWTQNTVVYARVEDAAGNWSNPASKTIPVAEGTPPGTVTDLQAASAGSLEYIPNSIDDYSSAGVGTPITALLDGDTSTYWQTEGTASPETEFVTLDVLQSRTVASVLIIPARYGLLFPTDFTIETSEDGVDWQTATDVTGFKYHYYYYLYEFEPVDARYIRLSGPGVVNAYDRRYYWRMSDVFIYDTSNSIVSLRFTAPADDGYLGQSCAYYDVRYNSAPVTEANWSSSTQASGLGSPSPAGHAENGSIRIAQLGGSCYVAVKAVDAAGNASAPSNCVQVDLAVNGFVPNLPDDGEDASADDPATFDFLCDPSARPSLLSLSTSPSFPKRPTAREDGQLDRTMRIPVTRKTSFTPSAGQWQAIKRMLTSDLTLYWRLEGASGALYMTSQTRSLNFDAGLIDSLSIEGSHLVDADEGIWPEQTAPPVFQWSYNGDAMQYFNVVVSSDETMPLRDRTKTMTLGGRGAEESSYTPSAAEWKRIRKLAAGSGGVLYWRVSALDSARALKCMSDPQTLVIDGGTWTLDHITLGADPLAVAWTHDAGWQPVYRLEFSVDDTFASGARYTLVVPSRGVPGDSYELSAREVARLRSFAARNGLAVLRYRVRAENADRAFAAWSPSRSATIQ